MRHMRHDAMRDSILSRSLSRCIEMEPSCFYGAVQCDSVRSLCVVRACDARAAIAIPFFHADRENIRARINGLGARIKLDVSPVALAQFLARSAPAL